MTLDRPLLFFDLEATGLSVEHDRIIEIACVRLLPGGEREVFESLVNPERPVPPVVVELTGIDPQKVASAPTFREVAPRVESLLQNADLAGYNIMGFDVPLLRAEFGRLKRPLPGPHDRVVIDMLEILRKHEIRSLDWTHRFYFGRPVDDAHRAIADVEASRNILEEQIQRYALSGSAREMARALRHPFLDSKRKLKLDEDGRITVNFGKHVGTPLDVLLTDDPSYVGWMLEALDPEIGDLLRVHLTEEDIATAREARQPRRSETRPGAAVSKVRAGPTAAPTPQAPTPADRTQRSAAPASHPATASPGLFDPPPAHQSAPTEVAQTTPGVVPPIPPPHGTHRTNPTLRTARPPDSGSGEDAGPS